MPGCFVACSHLHTRYDGSWLVPCSRNILLACQSRTFIEPLGPFGENIFDLPDDLRRPVSPE